MISETRRLNLVEQVISEENVPWTVQRSHKRVRKITNGNFISAIYAYTNKGTKWVSVQKNKCPETITVKSNYLKGRDNLVNDVESVERLFTKVINRDYQKGKIGKYKFYKFTK